MNSAAPDRPPHWRSDLRHAFTSLVRLPPSPGPRLPIATQAALAIAVPIVVMTALGRTDLGLQAASGAFALLFGSHLPPVDRVGVIPVAAAGLVASAALGALAGLSAPATLIGGVLVAVVSAALAFGFSLGPPGPLFFVLVFGLSAHLAAAGVDRVASVAAIAAGTVFAWLLSALPLLRVDARRTPRRPLRELLPGPRWSPDARLLLARVAVVAVVGTLAALWVDPDRAYWIVTAAIGVIGVAADRGTALLRGVHRTAGTVVGAGLFLVLGALPWDDPWAGFRVALVLGALQFAIELVVVRNYALALAFITPLVLLLTGAATGDMHSPGIALERIVDTLVGAALGAVTGVLHPRRIIG
ncbi:FUSC family protein [Microbacterium sp. JZ31]|uniref:FUSC family protein n=1 Tax=Microbacterium sp. JZ31 TaxID=1906274 RepID=UPI0019343534|nr:FUSC family protein [Microbacterium sp. JZ31]